MTIAEPRPPVSPGEPAPDFTLPAVDRPEPVSLADYRGRTALFLALFVGLWCPFCRRAIAQMGQSEGPLRALGVETLGVVATSPENARLYFRFRPTRMRLAADPGMVTHRAYGLPRPDPTPELLAELGATRVNPGGVLPAPLPVPEAGAALARLDGYQANPTDQSDMASQGLQLKGQFLIDRGGIVRWAHVECAEDGLAGVGRFPSEAELLAAARALPR
jgi:peroxiredoxin